MKKQISGSQIRLMLCLIIVAIFALSYQYIYLKYENLSEDYNNKTTSVNQQIALRKEELSKENELKTHSNEMVKQCEDIIVKYPIKITKEDNLIFIENLEKELNIDIPSVTTLESSDFYITKLPARDENGNEIIVDTTAAQEGTMEGAATDTAITETSNTDTANSANTDTVNTDTTNTTNTANTDTTNMTDPANNASDDSNQSNQFMTAQQSQINISFQTTNSGFKRFVDYINSYPETTSIPNASLSYDSATGELLASITINRYSLTGTGKVYEEPYIGDISIGTDNLFGTPAEKKK